MTNEPPKLSEIIESLESKANPDNVAGMQRFGIRGEHMLGVSVSEIRELAKGIHNHRLALQLWETGIHEARVMASIVEVPAETTRKQLDAWVKDFDSWDVCDQVCTNVVDVSPYAIECIHNWANREEEYVRRAAFASLAGLAVHNKSMQNDAFEQFFALIKKHSTDPRNFVKKAVNWALRNIGKRNQFLCERAIQVSGEIQATNDRTARWIASDALRELRVKMEKFNESIR